MQLDPAHRPSITEVMAHPWMLGPTPSQEEVHTEFLKRDLAVKSVMDEQRKQKEEEKKKRVVDRLKKTNRSGPDATLEAKFDESDDALFKPLKALDNYDRVYAHNTEFYSTYNPDMIEEALTESLFKQNDEVKDVKRCQNKYKVKFTMITKDQSGVANEVEMCVRILRVDDKKVCVEFMKLNGDQIRFHEHFAEFRDQVLKDMNDAIL